MNRIGLVKLIELLLIIAIIGIITVNTVPKMISYYDKAKGVKEESNNYIKNIEKTIKECS